MAIKTEKAAKQLRWIGAEKIKRMDEDALKAEQDDYQKLFGEELAKIGVSANSAGDDSEPGVVVEVV